MNKKNNEANMNLLNLSRRSTMLKLVDTAKQLLLEYALLCQKLGLPDASELSEAMSKLFDIAASKK